jgi:hypothetical protein
MVSKSISQTLMEHVALACYPDLRPRQRFESGYFQVLEWRRGDGTEEQIDRGDRRISA